MLRFELMEELKNIGIVLLATYPKHRFSFEGLKSLLDGVTKADLLQEGVLYPVIGYVFIFFFSRTAGVLLREWWDRKIKGKFDKWRRSRK